MKMLHKMLPQIKFPHEKFQTKSLSLELTETELNPDKSPYIGICDVLKQKMDQKKSKNVDPSSIIITSFYFHPTKWKVQPTSVNTFHLSF